MTIADLPRPLYDALVRVGHVPHLLVAMDFDGTMSPLVSRAEDARPLPAAAAAFAALSGLEGTTTALVSGRALASLRAVATPPAEALLVGSHGAEVWLGPDSAPLELNDSQQDSLAQALHCVDAVVASHPGTVAERKPAGVVLHYRQASTEAASDAVEHVRNALAKTSGLYITEGKMVLEVSAIRSNKGESIALLREVTGADAIIFAGDDVTDEHAFAALAKGDLGIKVGPGATAASFRIPSAQALPAVLELLLSIRTSPGAPRTP